MYQHSKNIFTAGLPVEQAKSALVMIHGRGATAQNMLSLANYLDAKDLAFFAPQATHQSWYPTRFIAPVQENQPALDSALELIHDLVQDIISKGIPAERIYFLGFSQGACLALEYVSRHAMGYAGVIAFTGGLIGEHLEMDNYKGDFKQTPVLISSGDQDPHVPLSRVNESAVVMEGLNAHMHVKIYPNKQHAISNEEIAHVNELFFKSSAIS